MTTVSAHSRSATLWLRAFATPVVLRREGRRGRPYTDVGPGRAVLVGAVVPVAHAPACVGGIAACTVWMHLNGVSVPVWDGVRESRDVLFGLGASAALGVALVPAFRWAAPSRQSSSKDVWA